VVIYNVKYEMTNKFYIGNTQQFFKNRMRGHFQDAKQYVEKGVLHVLSDSYARHFGGLVPKGARSPTPGEQRARIFCGSSAVHIACDNIYCSGPEFIKMSAFSGTEKDVISVFIRLVTAQLGVCDTESANVDKKPNGSQT
jgi:hypothetical protein